MTNSCAGFVRGGDLIATLGKVAMSACVLRQIWPTIAQ
jgi:hypothetical protein